MSLAEPQSMMTVCLCFTVINRLVVCDCTVAWKVNLSPTSKAGETVRKVKVFPPPYLWANELLALYVGKKLTTISIRISPHV